MNHDQLTYDLYTVECQAIKALPFVPKRSIYRKFIYDLLAERLEAKHYRRLKNRLHKFHTQS